MQGFDMTRRSAIGGFALLGAGLAPEGISFARASAAVADLPDLETPEGNLRQIRRISASYNDEDVPWYYTGLIYGIVGERQPMPFFRFEGMEVYRMTDLGDGSYEMTGNTVTFFRDAETGAMLSEFKNPITGQTVPVSASVQGGGPGRGYTYSLAGIKPTMLKDQMPDDPPGFEWAAAGDVVWLHSSRVYPPGMTPPRDERQSTFVRRADLANPDLPNLPAQFSSTFFAPWLNWLDMGDEPGHMVWHAAGTKIASFADLPSEYRTRLERDHADRMTGKPEAGTGGKKVE